MYKSSSRMNNEQLTIRAEVLISRCAMHGDIEQTHKPDCADTPNSIRHYEPLF